MMSLLNKQVTSEQSDITVSFRTVVPKVDIKGCAAKSGLVKRVYAMPFSQMSQLTHCTTSSVDYLVGDPARFDVRGPL